MITKKSDGYYVMSHEGKSLGGPYKTKKEAQNRLAQVESFKKHQSGDKLEGKLDGPPHSEGGVKFKLDDEIQEAEGGEYVVKKEAVQALEEIYGKAVFDDYINQGMLPPQDPNNVT